MVFRSLLYLIWGSGGKGRNEVAQGGLELVGTVETRVLGVLGNLRLRDGLLRDLAPTLPLRVDASGVVPMSDPKLKELPLEELLDEWHDTAYLTVEGDAVADEMARRLKALDEYVYTAGHPGPVSTDLKTVKRLLEGRKP